MILEKAESITVNDPRDAKRDRGRFKVYELKNADPAQMVTMLREMFRPQITATQNAGR